MWVEFKVNCFQDFLRWMCFYERLVCSFVQIGGGSGVWIVWEEMGWALDFGMGIRGKRINIW